LVSRTRALRAPCGGKVWVFSVFGVILTPKTEKTPFIIGIASALSAEAMPLLREELNAYQIGPILVYNPMNIYMEIGPI
jgi:hypothetical protein